MIKQEWKNILKNHWIQIVLVALILIPSIYTVVFLGSMWDPYGNSGDLPVAVVNKDKAVEYNDKKLDVGDQLVKKLKDNDSLDFHFVNSKEANISVWRRPWVSGQNGMVTIIWSLRFQAISPKMQQLCWIKILKRWF